MDYFWIVLLLWSPILNIAGSCPVEHQHSSPTAVGNFGQLSRRKCAEYHPISNLTITGGNLTLPKEYPHMAVLGYGDGRYKQWGCGGSLVSKKFVVTAAHCLDKNVPKYVRLGDWDLSSDDDDAQPQDFKIVNITSHPCYKPPIMYHDIALLELDREAEFTDYVSPACLNTEKEFSETELIATGWGKTEYGGFYSDILLKVELDHIHYEQCVKKFQNYQPDQIPHGIIHDFQLCAGNVRGKDTCQGDSGGPLQIENHERSQTHKVHNIFGVTSFGKPCGLEGTPGIYTRISHYIPWIENIAWQYETGN